jgi:hypothetical protein
MLLSEGKAFDQAKPEEVVDFLRSRKLELKPTPAERLHVVNDGQRLALQLVNGKMTEYPMRRSFLFKLLRWHSFPLAQLRTLNIDTVTGILNDYLLSVRSGDVTLVVEDGEALTVTSGRFNRMEDLTILHRCKDLGVERISRNDFFTRFYTETLDKKEIVKGDDCGFGLNILNSETGFRALSVSHYILRYVCTNGAVVRIGGGTQTKVHYGWPDGELEAWLAERIEAARSGRAAVAGQLRSANQTDWPALPRMTARRLRGILGPGTSRPFLEELDGSGSLYEGFNRMTEQAKSLPLERRFELESLAGQLIADV